MAWLAPWVLVVGGAGCSSSGSSEKLNLTRVDPASATACPAGGVVISTGVDKNGSGALDDSEVTGTSTVCSGTSATNGMNGTNGHNGLVNTVDLPIGDMHCPSGGTEIDTGLDNGNMGGTADDGVLQTGEVTTTKYVCNGATGGEMPGSTTPPTGPAGTKTIDASGGNASTGTGGGSGGAGQNVTISMSNGTAGGHVKVFDTGTVDGSFTVPTATFNGGTVVFTVSPTTPTVKVYADTTTGLASGDAFFFVTDDSSMYHRVDATTTENVTGVDIQMGATFTVPQNNPSYPRGYFEISNDLRNAGVLTTTADSGGNRQELGIQCGNFIGLNGSSIDMSGADVSSGTGGNGGYFDIEADGTAYNAGTATASGGSGESGGYGGTIEFDGDTGAVYNTGAITTDGGRATVDQGGGGGYIYLDGGYFGTLNSAALSASGADGVTGGGSGGYVKVYVQNYGPVVSAGAVSIRGGTGSASDAYGGYGGSFETDDHNGDLVLTGDVDTRGGDGKGNGSGGGGGSVSLSDDDNGNTIIGGFINTSTATGSIRVAASILTKGGAGNTGGDGGSISITLDPGQLPAGQEITLYGVTSISSTGGSSTNGGHASQGGAVSLLNQNTSQDQNGTAGPAGGVVNYAGIDTRGGTGLQGGSGGAISLATQNNTNFGTSYEAVINRGALNASAGSSSADGSNGSTGGSVYLVGIAGVDNGGAITANGGDCSGANCTGGTPSNNFPFGMGLNSSYGPVLNAKDITVSGGAATGTTSTGGNAGGFLITGLPVTNSGALTANGGPGVATGGNGGALYLLSNGTPTTDTGSEKADGGAGTTPGQVGFINVDGTQK